MNGDATSVAPDKELRPEPDSQPPGSRMVDAPVSDTVQLRPAPCSMGRILLNLFTDISPLIICRGDGLT